VTIQLWVWAEQESRVWSDSSPGGPMPRYWAEPVEVTVPVRYEDR